MDDLAVTAGRNKDKSERRRKRCSLGGIARVVANRHRRRPTRESVGTNID